MDGFAEGFDFYANHAAEFTSVKLSVDYVNSVKTEIDAFLEAVSHFKGVKTDIEQLKGDIAEFWHAGTFNMNAAARGSSHRVKVNRSHAFASADISGVNFDADFSLKTSKYANKNAKDQSKSVFEAYNEYKSDGGKETFDEYLKNRGYQDDSVLHDPIYSGQIRIIPAKQLDKARDWLRRKIAEVETTRPEQAARYGETLRLLDDRVRDGKGNESIELTEEDAKKLAELAKKDGIDPSEWNLTTEELIKFEYLMKQAFKAGLTAAIITAVLRTAPELINAVKYLIDNGELDEEEYRRIGFTALSGAAEGFIRGSISAAITTALKAGLLGPVLKSVDPSIVGAVTIVAMDALKNAYKVATGEMSRYEMANELIRDMFVSTCALVGGGITQCIIEIPLLGFMIGNMVGSLAGSFAYSAAYQPAISFCVDTGFTMFGLVKQDYRLPKDILEEIGIDVFQYESFDYEHFEYERFEYERFEYERFEPLRFDMVFLRRGVIGVNAIGYI